MPVSATDLYAYIRRLEDRIARLEGQEVEGGTGVGFNDSEGDPAAVGSAADGTSIYAARRDHVHALGDGTTLAEILDDDGAGSGLDADLLDGQEGAAYHRVDGSNYITGNLGVGVSPLVLGHFRGATPIVRIDGDAANLTSELRFYDNLTTLKGRLVYAGGNASPNKYFGFINTAAEDLRFFSDLTQFWSLSAELARLDSSGRFGIGTTSPQGKLHVANGVYGSMLFIQAAAINTTAQTLIPNGTGDVTKQLWGLAIVTNGTNHTATGISMVVGGTQGVTVGSDTYTFRVNADGSADVRRTAGSNNGQVSVLLLWI